MWTPRCPRAWQGATACAPWRTCRRSSRPFRSGCTLRGGGQGPTQFSHSARRSCARAGGRPRRPSQLADVLRGRGRSLCRGRGPGIAAETSPTRPPRPPPRTPDAPLNPGPPPPRPARPAPPPFPPRFPIPRRPHRGGAPPPKLRSADGESGGVWEVSNAGGGGRPRRGGRRGRRARTAGGGGSRAGAWGCRRRAGSPSARASPTGGPETLR